MKTLLPLVLALAACSSEAPAPPKPAAPAPVAAPAAPVLPEKVQKAVTIANAIKKDPTRVDAILAENGTTRADFEALLYEIAADPALAYSYSEARGS